MATISARGLSKSYAGKPAVRDPSFDVAPGSVTGFLGPNGAFSDPPAPSVIR